jgi:rod shape-determining protein MreC
MQQVVAYIVVGAMDLWSQYVELHNVKSENIALKKELEELHNENQRLRNSLALAGGEMELKAFHELYRQTYAFEPIDAMVIGAGTMTGDHSVILNKGSIDGVKADMGVICPTGVVGKVIRVGPTSCLVRLITDQRFAVSVRLQGSRVRGIVQGTGGDEVKLLFIRDTDAVEIDDRVVSSGLERIFPRGILVGRVKSVTAGEPPLRNIDVIPSAELRSLEWVLIVQWHEEISDQDF